MHLTALECARVLEAKLHPPAHRPTWVDRPALLDELEADAAARLTVISAPAGSGKSTLLAQWVGTRRGRDLAWLTLDEGDNNPVVFWAYVVSALRTVRPAFGTTLLRRLSAPGVDVADEVLPLLANALVELEPVTLVLDELHTITDEAVYEGLLYLIDRLPPRARIVAATQVDPPLPLSRLRAYGDLREIRDLRFSSDQAAALLRAVLGIEVSPDDAGRVQEWTEGWAAGVLLAGLSARGRDDPVAFLNDLPADDPYVVDFLSDEVLARQRPDVRRFLGEISILEGFSAELCGVVTGRDDAEQLLSELDRANVFLVTLNATRRWYRFHQVFRATLDRELAALAPNDVADLHRRASEWYGKHGLPYEAIEHAVAAGDMHYTADQLVRNWIPLYSEGRGYAILGWLDRLPYEIVASNPGVCLLASGLARSLGRREDAERWLALVETDAPLKPEVFPVFGHSTTEAVAINRSMLHLARGDVDGALAEARRAEAVDTDEHGIGRVVASFFLAGVLFFADDAESAKPLLERFLTDPRTAEQHARSYYALALLAYIALDRNDIEEALRLARQALEQARAHDLDEYPQTGFAHGALGSALLATGDLDDAEEHLEQAVALVRRGREGSDIALMLLHLGRLRLRQSDREAARDALNAARSALEVAGLPRITRLDRELSRELGSAGRKSGDRSAANELTEAELRVLRMLPYELTYREIAGRLFISMNTLKTHTMRIRRKLEVANRSEAVASARRRGLL
jgi:LuxR family transcriptional regulator, maltose regulon positive regulatory protein